MGPLEFPSSPPWGNRKRGRVFPAPRPLGNKFRGQFWPGKSNCGFARQRITFPSNSFCGENGFTDLQIFQNTCFPVLHFRDGTKGFRVKWGIKTLQRLASGRDGEVAAKILILDLVPGQSLHALAADDPPR